MRKLPEKRFLPVILSLFMFIGLVHAQPFVPNKNGYVTDPKFKTFLKARGYKLAGVFDTIQKKPLILRARVLKNGAWKVIDQKGIERPYIAQAREIKGTPYIDDDDESSNSKDQPDYRGIKYPNPFNRDFELIRLNGKTGVVAAKTKKLIIPAQYDRVWLSYSGFFAVKAGDKWGILDRAGGHISGPGYDEVKSLAVTMRKPLKVVGDAVIYKTGGKWGLLLKNGAEGSVALYDEIKSSWVINSLLLTTIDGKWGLMNKQGRELLKPTYDEIGDFTKKGTAIARTGKDATAKYGLIDTLGNELVKPVYDKIQVLADTLIKVSIGKLPDAKEGLVNSHGIFIAKAIYSYIDAFYQKTALVIINSKRGYIDTRGAEVVAPVYEDVSRLNDKLFLVKLNGKYGVANAKLGYVLKPTYDAIGYDPRVNLFFVTSSKKQGAVDASDHIIIPMNYDKLTLTAHKDRIIYAKDKKYGLIDPLGKPVTLQSYDDMENQSPFGLVVHDADKFGVTDYNGKILIPLKYDKLPVFDKNGLAKVSLDGKTWSADLYGNEYPGDLPQ